MLPSSMIPLSWIGLLLSLSVAQATDGVPPLVLDLVEYYTQLIKGERAAAAKTAGQNGPASFQLTEPFDWLEPPESSGPPAESSGSSSEQDPEPLNQPSGEGADVPLDTAEQVLQYLKQQPEAAARRIPVGLSVPILLSMADYNTPADCTREELSKRRYICFMSGNSNRVKVKSSNPIKGLMGYCRTHLLAMFQDCARELKSKKSSMTYEDKKLWYPKEEMSNGSLDKLMVHLYNNLIYVFNAALELDAGPLRPTRHFIDLHEAELLSREQLLDITENGRHLTPVKMMIHMSMVKDKPKTVIARGVTVADLLEMNDLSQEHCTIEKLIERNGKCLQMANQKLIEFRQYCRKCLRLMANNCIDGFDRAAVKNNQIDPLLLPLHDIADADELTLGKDTELELNYLEKYLQMRYKEYTRDFVIACREDPKRSRYAILQTLGLTEEEKDKLLQQELQNRKARGLPTRHPT